MFVGSALAAAAPLKGASRRWQLGLNTYCLRFQRWNDRQLIDYCVKEKLDAIFLQDSLDPDAMEPKHWADVRAWVKDAHLHIETGGSAMLPKSECWPHTRRRSPNCGRTSNALMRWDRRS